MKGSYILIINLQKNREIQIGKLGKISFKSGYYAYVGSALNGLEQRVNRHLRKSKKKHWHIDYFLEYADIVDVFYKENNKKEECKVAKLLSKLSSVDGFGCSDCNCNSHLFYNSEKENIMQKLKSFIVLPIT